MNILYIMLILQYKVSFDGLRRCFRLVYIFACVRFFALLPFFGE